MSIIDKLKNVFFEEVEDEEEEVPKTFAKKVEVPKKKFNFIKADKEEKEDVKEKDLDVFLEEEDVKLPEEPKDDSFVEIEESESSKVIPMMFDEDDFQEDKNTFDDNINNQVEEKVYRREDRNESINRELYSGKKESYKDGLNEKVPYAYTKESRYEEKEKKIFKPSPIISPIYGILDKNYRKEEVVTKRETRISSSYSKVDLDSVRNKAFKETEIKEKPQEKRDDYKEKRKVYDVNNDKPHVNKVTIADAEEYYNDLGLAYNVDYSDASRNTESKNTKYSREKKKEKKDADDNLFDLIDSMYGKED